MPTQVPAGPREVDRPRGGRRRGPLSAGSRYRGIAGQRVHPTEQHPAINLRHPIVVSSIDAVGVGKPDPRLLPDIALDPEKIVDRVAADPAGNLVIHGRHETETDAPRSPRKLGGGDRGHDPAGVDQLRRGREVLDSIEKERPFLLKEDRTSGIGGNLTGIRFNLGKVRINGSVQSHVGRDAPLDVAAELRAPSLITPIASCRAASLRRGGDDRIQLQYQAPFEAGQPDEATGLSEERSRGPAHRGPSILAA